MADPSILRWRAGRKVGRTIYAQRGPDPSDDDVLIGTLDTPALAAEAVAAHNAARAARLSRPDGGKLPDGTYEAADEAFEGGGTLPPGARDELEAALLAAAPLIRAAERARWEAALRRHMQHFTDPKSGTDLCGGCLEPSPCPDAGLIGDAT